MIDADVIIGGEKGAFDLKAWLQSLENEQFEIAAITVAELWHGSNELMKRIRELERTTSVPFSALSQ